MTQIGILALQGDFAEHRTILQGMGVPAREVRLPADLTGLDGLIIPGGESTTIGKLAVTFELMDPLRRFGQDHALWGTCAGAILLSKDAHREQPLLGLMDISVKRNAFGRQVDSFIAPLNVPALEDGERPFPAVFIRAPILEDPGVDVNILATIPSLEGKSAIVAARQDHLLATSFHPELTGDDRFHRYFVRMAGG